MLDSIHSDLSLVKCEIEVSEKGGPSVIFVSRIRGKSPLVHISGKVCVEQFGMDPVADSVVASALSRVFWGIRCRSRVS